MLFTLLAPLALAAELDRLEDPLRTGLKSPADAAVVFGAETYYKVAAVPFARRDAQLVYDWLVYSRGVRPEAVQLVDHDVTRENMLAAVDAAVKSVGEGGRLWVYFAGHGAADPSTGERLWLGDDVSPTPSSFTARGLPVARVHEAAATAGVDAILLSDACYSGRGRGGEDLAAGARFVVPLAALPSPTRGIVEWDATSTTEIAGPLRGADHGAFTWFLVGALRGWADGETDGTRDGNVSLDEASLYVARALHTVQVTSQRPVLIASDSGASVLAIAKEEGPDLGELRRALAAIQDSGRVPAAPAALPAVAGLLGAKEVGRSAPMQEQVGAAPKLATPASPSEASAHSPFAAADVSVSEQASCALSRTGQAHCWGNSGSPIVKNAQPGPFVAVELGDQHACALTPQGEVHCWGDDTWGQVSDAPQGTFRALYAEAETTCAIAADRSGDTTCWGLGQKHATRAPTRHKALGMIRVSSSSLDRLCGVDMTGHLTDCGSKATTAGGLVQVSAQGTDRGCALLEDATVTCWGIDEQPPVGETYLAVRFNGNAPCGLSKAGHIECWAGPRYLTETPSGIAYTAFDLGRYFGCAVALDGAVDCWGTSMFKEPDF